MAMSGDFKMVRLICLNLKLNLGGSCAQTRKELKHIQELLAIPMLSTNSSSQINNSNFEKKHNTGARMTRVGAKDISCQLCTGA